MKLVERDVIVVADSETIRDLVGTRQHTDRSPRRKSIRISSPKSWPIAGLHVEHSGMC